LTSHGDISNVVIEQETTMKEEWKAIHGYEGWYEVSSNGRIRRIRCVGHGTRKNYVLRAGDNGKGYLSLMLCKHGEPHRRYVHILVARAFHGPCPPRHEVNHKNGKKHDNHASNLEYMTRAQQNLHACRVLGVRRGSKHYRARLSEDAVRTIRKLAKAGSLQRELAAMFDVGQSTISQVVTGRNWTHV
jgi:hypothetical protein